MKLHFSITMMSDSRQPDAYLPLLNERLQPLIQTSCFICCGTFAVLHALCVTAPHDVIAAVSNAVFLVPRRARLQPCVDGGNRSRYGQRRGRMSGLYNPRRALYFKFIYRFKKIFGQVKDARSCVTDTSWSQVIYPCEILDKAVTSQ